MPSYEISLINFKTYMETISKWIDDHKEYADCKDKFKSVVFKNNNMDWIDYYSVKNIINVYAWVLAFCKTWFNIKINKNISFYIFIDEKTKKITNNLTLSDFINTMRQSQVDFANYMFYYDGIKTAKA